MSYVSMDHAGWVERQLEAMKRGKPTARDRCAASDHKGWFAAPDQLTPFQRRAFHVLGIVGNGIYNAPIAWRGIIWHPRQLIVPWGPCYGLGTFDFMELTRLVFLCHEARIRGYVEAGAPRRLNIWLSERSHEGGMSQRHPSLDEAIAAWRAEFPANHPIAYRMPAVEAPRAKPVEGKQTENAA